MPLQLDAISGKRKLELIKLGRSYSSTDTLAQGRKTLNAYDRHGPKLKKHGFRSPDAAELRDATDMLASMESTRMGKKGEKRTFRKGYRDVVDDALGVRQSCRNEMTACRNVCMSRGLENAVSVLDTALEQTSRTSRGAQEIADQLSTLEKAMVDPAVAPIVAEREANDIMADLARVIPLLLHAEGTVANPRGTPQETETMDTLDGIIVTHARAAYKAAKLVAKELGEPSIAKAFETDLLSRTRSSSNGGAGGGAGGDGGGDGGGTGGDGGDDANVPADATA